MGSLGGSLQRTLNQFSDQAGLENQPRGQEFLVHEICGRFAESSQK